MGPVVPHLRNVRDSHQFMADMVAVFGTAQAADEILNDIKFVLAREPQAAGIVRLNSGGIYLLKTRPVPVKGKQRRSLLLLFTYDQTQVEMLRLL